MVGAAAMPRTTIPPIEPPPPHDAAFAQYDVIASRNLFKAKPPPRRPVTEDLKESSLQLKLCGTFAATKPERSVACIDDTGAQKRRAYRVSEEIADGVKLISVDRRRAVIDNRGSREQLSMEEVPPPARSCPGRSRPGRRRRSSAPPRSSPTG